MPHFADAQGLPLIDLGSRGAAAAEIDRACSEFGFFYIVGHGVDDALTLRLMELSRRFFAQDEATKSRIHLSRGGRAWRGYFPVGGELTSGKPDLKEGIYFGSELSRDDARVRAGTPLHGPNLFPDMPGFRDATLEYLRALTGLGQELMALIGRGLGLGERYFIERYTGDPTILFRIFNYPPAPRPDVQQWGVGAHSDYGLLTILKQDSVGGLQVRYQDRWLDVPDVPGSFVCNVGDMLERLTNGRYVSALHRVRNVSDRSRLSMPFFFDPAFDAELNPIPGVGPESARTGIIERWDGMDLRNIRGTYGDYLIAKVSKVFPELSSRYL